MVTRLVQLKYSDANTVSATMKQLTTKDGDCYPYTPTNLLIISDTASNIVRLMQIINQLDTPQGQEEIRVIQLKFALVNDLSPKLLEIFGDKSKTGTPGPGGQVTPRIQPVRLPGVPGAQPEGEGGEEAVRVSKIIPDERTNKLIVVASSRSFPQIRQVIDQLDVPVTGGDQLQVIYLENANAEEIASTLTALAQGSATRSKTSTPPPGATGMPGAKAAELFQGEVKVTSAKSTNSLVVMASKHDFMSLIQVVKKLDIPRRQVFVEAVLMEVNMDSTRDTGFAFHGGTSTSINGDTVPLFFGTQYKVQGSTNFNSLSLTNDLSLLGFISGAQGPALSSSQSILNSVGVSLPSFGVMLEALQTDSNVNVISTPHILTSDNEQAEIKVGDNIPIPAGYSPYGSSLGSLAGLSSLTNTSTTGAASSLLGTSGLSGMGGMIGGLGMASIQRQDVGLVLKIKPQINKGNYIRMELEEELSDVKDQGGVYGPTTTKRSAKTVVVVQDQQTVVVGGLIRDSINITETKVPLLGDIPVIGFFFRNRNVAKSKTNLLLFLTPYVIESAADFKVIFERKIRERKEFLEKFYNAGKDYESFVDYRRKHGPLADMHLVLRQELQRTENGGPGLGTEVLITPTPESVKTLDGGKPAAEGTKSAPDEKPPAENKSAPESKPTPDEKAAPTAAPSAPGENSSVVPTPVTPEEAAPVAPDEKVEPSPAERLEVE
jgi:general secretion pathway protein D